MSNMKEILKKLSEEERNCLLEKLIEICLLRLKIYRRSRWDGIDFYDEVYPIRRLMDEVCQYIYEKTGYCIGYK